MFLKRIYHITKTVKLETIEDNNNIYDIIPEVYVLTDNKGNSTEYATFGQLAGKVKRTHLIHVVIENLDDKTARRLEDIVSDKFCSSTELRNKFVLQD